MLQGRDYWARFERFVKTLAWSSDDVYIVTGPLYVPQRTPQGYVMHHPMIGLSHSHKHLCSLHLQAGLFLCGEILAAPQDMSLLLGTMLPVWSARRYAGMHACLPALFLL